ncbi:MAG TPA: N-acetylmuramoyl-L-alanine amidase [Limnochordales bacterium]
MVLDGRLLAASRATVEAGVVWVPAGAVATRWGAQLDVGEDVLGWRDARTGRTLVFRRGVARAEADGRHPVALSAAPDWADGRLRFPVDAVAAAGEARWAVDERLGLLFLTRPDPYLCRFRIFLDPGHGGSETGASLAGGLAEKRLNWWVARRLAGLLAASGAVVGLSRDADQARSPSLRCAAARQMQAQLAVSIHHGPAEAYGAAEAGGTAGKAGTPGPAGPGPAGWVEGYHGRRGDGRRLAAALVAAVARELGVPGRGVREAHLGILACLPGPSALVQTCLPLVAGPGPHPRRRLARRAAWLGTREALGLLQGLRAYCSEAHRDSVAWPGAPV